MRKHLSASTRLLLLPILLALTTLAACGGSDGGPTGPNPATGTIIIQNNSSFAIVEINISRCELDTWGGNRLSSPLNPGSSRSFQLTPNCYDARAIVSSGDFVTFFDIVLNANQTESFVVFDL